MFPFRLAGVVGGSPNSWFGVEAEIFSHVYTGMKTEGASFDMCVPSCLTGQEGARVSSEFIESGRLLFHTLEQSPSADVCTAA